MSQWITEGTRVADGTKITVVDSYVVCRYGYDQILPPPCPPDLCGNSACTTCTQNWKL
jgi:hypothetical protein